MKNPLIQPLYRIPHKLKYAHHEDSSETISITDYLADNIILHMRNTKKENLFEIIKETLHNHKHFFIHM